MKKVLIISYYFPPINMMAAKRYGTMCRYFEKRGYKPYVLTTRCNRVNWLDVKAELECPISEDQIIRIGREDKNSIVKNVGGVHLLNALKSRGYESRTFSFSSIGWYEKVKEEIHLDQFRDIEILIGTFPPMENLFVAYYLSKELRIPYIVDIRDLISDYVETENDYKWTARIDQAVERYILSKAGGIVTVTPGFRDILKKRYPRQKFKVVFNGWDTRSEISKEFLSVGERTLDREIGKYLYYAGSLYLHRLESFTLLIRCIRKANERTVDKFHFVVRSIGPKELDAKAKKIVEQEEMQKYVMVLEAASESIVRAEQKNAYMNVVLSSIHEYDKALMTTIPGKVYELLRENAPVLAIVPKTSDVKRVLEYTQKGIASTNAREIEEYLLEEHKQYKGNGKISYFTREKQAERLCHFMDSILDV